MKPKRHHKWTGDDKFNALSNLAGFIGKIGPRLARRIPRRPKVGLLRRAFRSSYPISGPGSLIRVCSLPASLSVTPRMGRQGAQRSLSDRQRAEVGGRAGCVALTRCMGLSGCQGRGRSGEGSGRASDGPDGPSSAGGDLRVSVYAVSPGSARHRSGLI